MDVQVIGKYGASLDSFVQTTINRLLLAGLGIVLVCAIVALIFKGTALLLWDEVLTHK